MGITVSEIGGLLARFGNQIVNEQVNLACPFVGNGHLPKIKHTHEKGIVRVRATDGLQSTAQISDGAALPQGDNVSFVAGSYLPKIFFTRLSIPRGAAHLADGGRDGVRLVREELEVAGRQLGKLLGKAVFRAPICNILNADGAVAGITSGTGTAGTGIIPGSAATWSATEDALGDIFLVNTVAGLYEGQFLQIPDGTGAQFYRAQVTAISYQANVIPGDMVGSAPADVPITYSGGTVGTSFAIKCIVTDPSGAGGVLNGAGVNGANGQLVPGSDPAVLEDQHLTGASGVPPALPALTARDPMVSLSAACGSSDLYNMGVSQPDVYKGNTHTVAGALTADAMRTMSTTIKRRCGYGWKTLVMNSLVAQKYFADIIAETNSVNYLPGETAKDIDGGAATPMFQGMPIVIDENVDDHVMYFFNGDDVKLAEFKDFSTDQDGGAANHGMVDRFAFIYDTQIWGMYNMRVTRRNSQGMLNGIN